MAEAAATAALSLADFLAWEEAQEMRYERVAGVVRMMAGGTGDHDQIAVNIQALLRDGLRGKGCTAHGSNLKVVSPGGDVFYPDAFVRCGPPVGRGTSADDPVIVFEVLSEGTAQHDLTRKRLAYKTIPSLKAVMYVSEASPRIDVLRRQPDGYWYDEDAVDDERVALELPEIGIRLALKGIYMATEVTEHVGRDDPRQA